MVSIKDVADRAGVSDKTVSRVVNRESSVKSATRARVEKVITEMGYVPNQAARLMRLNRSSVIGVMTDVVATTPNSVELIGGMQDRLSEEGLSVLIANTGGTADGERRVWRTFQEHRINGVLYATMYHHEVELAAPGPPSPTVLVNCRAPDRPDLAAIVPDDYSGGQLAAEYAVSRGHSRIAFITLNPEIVAAKLRMAAFQDVLTGSGVEIPAGRIRSGYLGPEGAEALCAYDVAREMLDIPAAQRPTIVLSGNDEIALQIICAAHSLGLDVPNDVAVVGFDDFKLISTRVVPQLTTVALPYYQIGRRAADKLLQILAGDMVDRGVERIACPLIVRASA